MSNEFVGRAGFELTRAFPVASGVLVEPGDLLYNNSGVVAKMSAATDNLNFVGRAIEKHAATDPAGEITVGLATGTYIHEYALDAATDIDINDNLAWSADKTLTKSDTDPIAVAVEKKLQATKIRCIFKMPAKWVGDAA